MKIENVIQIVDSASLLTEFGIIRFEGVLANRQLLSSHEDFVRAAHTLSGISERVRYAKEYKGEEPPKIEPRIGYAELQHCNLLLLRAFEPEILPRLRQFLQSEDKMDPEKVQALCECLGCSPDKLNYFYVHPEMIVDHSDRGLGIRILNGNEIPNPKAGVVSLHKEFWYKISGIANRYRRNRYHPEAKSMAENAQRILDFVRVKVEEQLAEKNAIESSKN